MPERRLRLRGEVAVRAVEHAATATARAIARDGAVVERQTRLVEHGATVTARAIARDSAVGERQITVAHSQAEHPATVTTRAIAGDGTVREGNESFAVENPAGTIARAIAGDRAVNERYIAKGSVHAATESGAIPRDGAVRDIHVAAAVAVHPAAARARAIARDGAVGDIHVAAVAEHPAAAFGCRPAAHRGFIQGQISRTVYRQDAERGRLAIAREGAPVSLYGDDGANDRQAIGAIHRLCS